MDSCVGIDFYIGRTFENMFVENHVKFPEDLQQYLRYREKSVRSYKEKGPYYSIDLLLGLDQYADRVLKVDEIKQLILVSLDLMNRYNTDKSNEQKIRDFAWNLRILCEEALSQNQLILALGD